MDILFQFSASRFVDFHHGHCLSQTSRDPHQTTEFECNFDEYHN